MPQTQKKITEIVCWWMRVVFQALEEVSSMKVRFWNCTMNNIIYQPWVIHANVKFTIEGTAMQII